MADLLIELGCEELPAGSVVSLANQLADALAQHLESSGLYAGTPEVFATPRRLAARFGDVKRQQADSVVERRGPAVDAAYKEGEPTKALLGFLRSANATLNDLQSVRTDKGEWVSVQQRVVGKTVAEVLSLALPDIFKSLRMPKRMRWSDTPHEFLRPVSWLLALHGDEVVPLTVFDIAASNQTYGHRFHAPSAITLDGPGEYEEKLLTACVLADYIKRREKIATLVSEQAEAAGGRPVLEDDLLDEINALVEWPVAMLGRFDQEFLDIPKEALIQTMQENQRYVALLDGNGELMPAFITIANINSSNPQTVVDGNERVIRPRFADTMFFWNQDKQQPLSSWLPHLSRLLFQEKLGSVADKVERMQRVAEWLCSQLDADPAVVERAVRLCKCDLNTEIVKELPKMQGICGRYYALRDGESSLVADAMEQHYFPKQAGSELPEATVAQIVALADKTDTLVGIFGSGMIPTGAKDPFGLRRASIGILRILIEKQHRLDLVDLVNHSAASYAGVVDSIDTQGIVAYALERLKSLLIDQGSSVDVVDAVMAKALTRPVDIVDRIRAIEDFRDSEEALSLSAASKRMQNILNKVYKQDESLPQQVDSDLLQHAAEVGLYQCLEQLRDSIDAAMHSGDYVKAMQLTAQLREPVDQFFDDVMVMDEDLAIRGNRLALLQQINSLCNGVAELSQLRSGESGSGAVIS